MIKITLSGINGKMCQEIESLASIAPYSAQFLIHGGFGRLDDTKHALEITSASDLVIDFSSAGQLLMLLDLCVNSKTNLLIGTTGFSDADFRAIKDAAQYIAIFYASNTSVAVHYIAKAASELAAQFMEYDVEIIDYHHKYKKDAPSGTAIMIGQEIAHARNINFVDSAVFDRYNNPVRNQGEIGFSSVRAGNIFGEHHIMIAGKDEIITLKYQALNRAIYARGALEIAKWFLGKEKGFFSMYDYIV